MALQETLITDEASGIVKALWSQGDYGFYQIAAEGWSSGILSTWKKEIFEILNAVTSKGFLCVEGK